MIHTGKKEERFFFLILLFAQADCFVVFIFVLSLTDPSFQDLSKVIIPLTAAFILISFVLCSLQQESSNQAHLWADWPTHPHVVCQPFSDQNHLGHGH